MAAVDLDRLDSRLSRLQADQLYCLDGDSSLGIPKITGRSVPGAIADFRACISAMEDANERLKRLCSIYTCLMLKKAIGPLVLYRVENAEGDQQDSLFHRFSWEVHSKPVPAESQSISKQLTQRCALVPQSGGTGHDVYCFAFFTSSPWVAVSRPPEGNSDGVYQVLGRTFGVDPKELERGGYFNQDMAYEAALLMNIVGKRLPLVDLPTLHATRSRHNIACWKTTSIDELRRLRRLER
ncbi:uncharacterized protein LOC142768534 [Rhipicephalus microplus]|uniref:uncharacterized protein LOC142768534 n=1 Tax=Rhipicephalus microplus TaxID=6941 RepID=UPI003F6A8FAF